MSDKEAHISTKAALGFLQGSKLGAIACVFYAPYSAKAEALRLKRSLPLQYLKSCSRLSIIPAHFALIAGTR